MTLGLMSRGVDVSAPQPSFVLCLGVARYAMRKSAHHELSRNTRRNRQPLRPVSSSLAVHDERVPQRAICAQFCCGAIHKGPISKHHATFIPRRRCSLGQYIRTHRRVHLHTISVHKWLKNCHAIAGLYGLLQRLASNPKGGGGGLP